MKKIFFGLFCLVIIANVARASEISSEQRCSKSILKIRAYKQLMKYTNSKGEETSEVYRRARAADDLNAAGLALNRLLIENFDRLSLSVGEMNALQSNAKLLSEQMYRQKPFMRRLGRALLWSWGPFLLRRPIISPFQSKIMEPLNSLGDRLNTDANFNAFLEEKGIAKDSFFKTLIETHFSKSKEQAKTFAKLRRRRVVRPAILAFAQFLLFLHPLSWPEASVRTEALEIRKNTMTQDIPLQDYLEGILQMAKVKKEKFINVYLDENLIVDAVNPSRRLLLNTDPKRGILDLKLLSKTYPNLRIIPIRDLKDFNKEWASNLRYTSTNILLFHGIPADPLHPKSDMHFGGKSLSSQIADLNPHDPYRTYALSKIELIFASCSSADKWINSIEQEDELFVRVANKLADGAEVEVYAPTRNLSFRTISELEDLDKHLTQYLIAKAKLEYHILSKKEFETNAPFVVKAQAERIKAQLEVLKAQYGNSLEADELKEFESTLKTLLNADGTPNLNFVQKMIEFFDWLQKNPSEKAKIERESYGSMSLGSASWTALEDTLKAGLGIKIIDYFHQDSLLDAIRNDRPEFSKRPAIRVYNTQTKDSKTIYLDEPPKH